MKRIVAFVLTLILMLSLAACGGTESADTPVAEAQSSTAATEEAAATEAATEAAKELAEFEEIIAVDNEYCTIKITGIDADSLWGYSLKVYLENKSTDKTFLFSVDSASINGVMAEPLFAAEVAAGKKSNEDITFATDALVDNDVGDFTDLELSFRVYDNEDWLADPVATPTVHVYPYGEENAVTFVRQPQSTDTVLADNEYATVTLIGCGEDEIWGYSADLFIENKSDTSIMVSVDEASVNGFMVDPFYADSVSVGKSAFSSITWFESDLTDNGITEVESMEFVLRIYDSEDWLADDFFNEIVTITP